MEPAHFAALAAVSFLGAAVQGATGFGFAILTVPFYLLIMGSLAAIQVAAVTNLALSLMLVPWLFRDAPRKLLFGLVAGSVAGFPLGLAMFRAADLATMKLAVGGFITLFALLLAWRELRAPRGGADAGGAAGFTPMPAMEFGAGAASGLMAAALAMPGPAVMLYLAARRPGKQVSRAVTLTLFGFSYAAVCVLHTLWGGMGSETWLLALGLVPFGLVGALAGNWSARHLSEIRFRAATLAVLLASGLYAVWTSL